MIRRRVSCAVADFTRPMRSQDTNAATAGFCAAQEPQSIIALRGAEPLTAFIWVNFSGRPPISSAFVTRDGGKARLSAVADSLLEQPNRAGQRSGALRAWDGDAD